MSAVTVQCTVVDTQQVSDRFSKQRFISETAFAQWLRIEFLEIFLEPLELTQKRERVEVFYTLRHRIRLQSFFMLYHMYEVSINQS